MKQKLESEALENVNGGRNTGFTGRVVAKAGTPIVAVGAASPVAAAAPAGPASPIPSGAAPTEQTMRIECPNCHDIFSCDVMKPFAICKSCGKKIEIKG